MKRKALLFVALLSLLVLALAFTVSAESYFGEVEIIDLNSDGVSDININDRLNRVIEEGNADGVPSSESALVKIKCGCEAGSHTFPAYYVCKKESDNKLWGFNYSAINAVLPSYCSGATEINGDYIIAIELPNGYGSIYSGFF